MRAAVYDQYGDASVLKTVEVERPLLKPKEVMVEVKASSVNPVDWKIRRGNLKLLTGFGFPKQAGSDFAGVVRASNDYRYKPGDKVFGMLNPAKGGAYAEYASVNPETMCRLPENLEFHEAAVVPMAGLTALQTMKYKGGIQPGHHVLINACCGGVGHFAVQYCKAQGAKVTGICSTHKMATAYRLGADLVLDYKKQDILSGPGDYDIVLDPVGTIEFKSIRKQMKRNGVMIAFSPSPEIVFAWLYTFLTPRKLKFYLTDANRKDLEELRELIEAGKIKPLIQDVYPLERVDEAQRVSENGHATGKIAIKI